MITLDATVGGPAANSLLTLERAATLAESRVGGSVWDAFGAEEQKARLITATSILDALALQAAPATNTQALQLPRKGLPNRHGGVFPATVIPYPFELACIAIAIALPATGSDGASAPRDPALKKVKAGDVEVEFVPGGTTAVEPHDTSHLPADVARLLAPYLAPVPDTSGWSTSRIVRAS